MPGAWSLELEVTRVGFAAGCPRTKWISADSGWPLMLSYSSG